MQRNYSMRIFSNSMVGLLAGLSLAACGQTICQDGSSGNCQQQNGDVDANDSNGVTCDDPNETNCSGLCVDTDINPNFCGSCGTICDDGQGCASGLCVEICDPGQLLCGDDCVDPETNPDFCGASGTCSGTNTGTDCGENTCTNGVCTATRYIGSLTTTTGRWNFGNTPGVAGAELACQTLYNSQTAGVCSYSDLLFAQNQNELVGATDNAGNLVSSWFIVDPLGNNNRLQCRAPNAAPWTYQTAHELEGAQFVILDGSLGNLGVVLSETSAQQACGKLRSVACCNPPI